MRQTIALIAALLGSTLLAAQSERPKEYQVKAAYLYNFGRFIHWPAGAALANDFAVCVLGHDPFGSDLDEAGAGLSVDDRPVAIRRLTRVSDVSGCRVLFVGLAETPSLPDVLDTWSKAGILTVGESPNFAERGGIIQFVSDNSRVRFIVNRHVAEGAGFSLSSELLRVASRVLTERPQG